MQNPAANDLVVNTDTIAAIATGAGEAGVGVIRLSGPDAITIAEKITGIKTKPRYAHYVTIRTADGDILDRGLCISFVGPNSFTGENVAELQCHGGPVLLKLVLRRCLEHGARQAQAGEFSQRAFLNDKIDLLQAEAIADLIHSGSEAALRSANRTLSGEFSEQINTLLEQLIRLRVFVEAAIDFPEEEVDFIADSDVLQQLATLDEQIQNTLASAERGRRLKEGLKVVIAGAPNAGKSSLLNQLAGEASAIVTDIAGTTRDVLREHIHIQGMPLHVVDTAGLREASDDVEREGIRRARAEMLNADRILLVVDSTTVDPQGSAPLLIRRHEADIPQGADVTLIHNKCDLSGDDIRITNGVNPMDGSEITQIFLSARDGSGIDLLRQHLLDVAGVSAAGESDFSARERHILALKHCSDALERAQHQLKVHNAPELVAEDLRDAQDKLSSITGAFSSDALLGEIFSSFCIGK